jgi:hypothetical protein
MLPEDIRNRNPAFDLRLLPVLLAGVLMSAQINAGVYKCTDDAGRIQYTDIPCGESASTFRKQASPPPSAATPEQRMQKTRRLLDAMEAERNEEKRNAEQARAEKEKRKRNCGIARDRYRRLTTASRLYDLDEDGNRVILNDPQRTQAEARAKANIDQWCD